MDGQRVLEIVVSTWGVAMAVSPGLQIRQMLQTGQSDDVSVGYFGVLTIGFMLWVAYGISIDSAVLYFCNTVATIFGAATIVIALRLRSRATGAGALAESPHERSS
jgi:uncharacterized protein with PQ loop repeat